ncbi:helix-turn-helix protein [Cohnella sp. SGD-V74]|uniref:AraC family transcriptional regulator n=1 Tax=unclassified Cohnella TaxID=2636738 RepID=UPI000D42DB2A|nr:MULTISPECIES: helix-turn-helix domain-containing protein [unclassified Cohnella]PRX71083.1 helix-turn-helix protein [Cohnella sp. SGD-V74]
MKLLSRAKIGLRRRKTFVQMLVYFIVASVAGLTISTFYMYYQSSRTIVKEIGNHTEDSMRKAAHSTSYMMEWTLSYAQNWSRDSALVAYALGGEKDYYEDYKIWSALRKIQANNPLIESIYMLNDYTDTVVDTRSGIYTRAGFYDKEALDMVAPAELQGHRKLVPRGLEGLLNDIRPFRANLLTYVFPYEPNQSSSALIINIDERTVADLIGRNFSPSEGLYMLVDETGTIVASPGQNLFRTRTDYANRIDASGRSSGWQEIDGQGSPSLLVFADTSFTGHEGWRIVSIIPEKQLLGNVHALRNWTLLIYVPVVLATLFIVWLLAKKIYFPIQRLVRDIAGDRREEREDQEESELSLLSGVYRDQKSRLDRLSNTWRHYRGDARNAFLRGLIEKEAEYPEREMERRFADLGMRLPRWPIRLVLVRIDGYCDWASSYTEQEVRLLRYAMANIAEETMKGYALTAVDLDRDRVVLIVETEARSEAELLEHLRESQSSIKDYLEIETSLTVSPPLEDYADMHEAYKLTLRQAEERYFRGRGTIGVAKAERRESASAYKYPEERERKILNALKLGNEEETIRHLRTFVRETTDMSVSEGQLALTQLILNIGKTMNQIRKSDALGDTWDIPFIQETMSRLEVLQAVEEWLEERMREFLELQRQAANKASRNGQIVAEAIALIDLQLADPNLSSKWVADRMKMSINYLRSLFKEETGQPLADYIAKKRLERVVEQLVDTDRTVEEISVQMGFPAINSFYVAFKKKYGMTPNQYRKAYQQTPAPTPCVE